MFDKLDRGLEEEKRKVLGDKQQLLKQTLTTQLSRV